MKERPILFTGAMVRALLDGSKTQTRRVLKRQPFLSRTNPPNFSDTQPGDLFVCPDMFPTTDKLGSVFAECERIGVYHCMGQRAFAEKHSPYGLPGDRLYVRETWRAFSDGALYETPDVEVDYRATPAKWAEGSDAPWKPSIHMPRWASRILLEITSVRVERLQDISEADARAEGVTHSADPAYFGVEGQHLGLNARESYANLWDAINGDGSADANPWVWVVKFKRVTP